MSGLRFTIRRLRIKFVCWRHGHDWDEWTIGLIPLNPRYDQRPFRFRFCKRCRLLERRLLSEAQP